MADKGTIKLTPGQSVKITSGRHVTIVKCPRFNIHLIVDKLLEIEAQKGYSAAMLGVNTLNYSAICSLTSQGGPGNNPNLMPSRFMILKGASDKALKAAGNLNFHPHPLHPSFNFPISVGLMSQMLTWAGHYAGGYTSWVSTGGAFQQPDDLPDVLEGDLFSSLHNFLGKIQPVKAVKPATHEVKQGESLSLIAAIYNLPSWQILYEANKTVVGPNPDLIYPGQQLQVPGTGVNQMKEWLTDIGADGDFVAGDCFKFPARLFSLSMVDARGQGLAPMEPPGEFSLYRHTAQAEYVYKFPVKNYDEVSLYMPDIEDYGFHIAGQALYTKGNKCQSRAEYLRNRGEELEDDAHGTSHGLAMGALAGRFIE